MSVKYMFSFSERNVGAGGPFLKLVRSMAWFEGQLRAQTRRFALVRLYDVA